MKSAGLMLVVGVVMATALLFGVVALVRHDHIAYMGGEIQWDDVGFSVVSMRQCKKLGPHDECWNSCGNGTYFVVGLKVTNHAKRADYDMSKHVALICWQDQGYRVNPYVQRCLDAMSGTPLVPERLAPGESCVAELAYVMDPILLEPINPNLYLRISRGDSLLDTFDRVVLGDRRLDLATAPRRDETR